MYVSGWAFTGKENEHKVSIERVERYRELTHMNITITKRRSEYGYNDYKGSYSLDKDLSELDIAIYCDMGNTCFGANVSMIDGTFHCKIYID